LSAALAEIRALAGIVDELDYYAILGVERAAPASSIRAAYHAAARRFHPDVHRELDAGTRAEAERIAKRITEAYAVLRDPRRRQLYDERLAESPEAHRLRLVEAEFEAGRRSTEAAHGRTPNGRRYFTLARTELERGDVAAATRHLQMALTFEPDNESFRELLDRIRKNRR
jgi:curved DNA-binding protein CbpA